MITFDDFESPNRWGNFITICIYYYYYYHSSIF